MTGVFSLAALIVALVIASPVAALDIRDAERRVDASLLLPADLDGPTYVELVLAMRPRKLYDRTRDPTIPPYNEYGLWRIYAPIRVDVAALVIPFGCATPYVLLFDNFSLPASARGKIDPRPYHRALGL